MSNAKPLPRYVTVTGRVAPEQQHREQVGATTGAGGGISSSLVVVVSVASVVSKSTSREAIGALVALCLFATKSQPLKERSPKRLVSVHFRMEW